MLWKITERARCPLCGVPLISAAAYKWRANGKLTLRASRNMGIVVMNPDIFDEIFTETAEVLDYPVKMLAYETQRNVSKMVLADTFDGIPGSGYFKKNRLGYRMMVDFFYILSSVAGYSRSIKIKQTPHKYSVSLIRNPYQQEMMFANVVGAYEFLEGIPYENNWMDIGNNEHLVTAYASGKKPEISQRLQIDHGMVAKKRTKIEKCRMCGVPRVISERLVWEMENGFVRDKPTGIRIAFMVPAMIQAMFRELAAEVGDEIYEIITQCMRGWTARNIEYFTATVQEGGSKEAYLENVLRRYLGNFPARGEGFASSVVFNIPKVEIVIDNPHEEHLIAGTLRGIYESIMKSACRVSWKKVTEHTISFSIEPA